MKPIKTLFLLTAFLVAIFCYQAKGQTAQTKFKGSVLCKSDFFATNNSDVLANAYFKLNKANQSVGIGILAPTAKLHAVGSFISTNGTFGNVNNTDAAFSTLKGVGVYHKSSSTIVGAALLAIPGDTSYHIYSKETNGNNLLSFDLTRQVVQYGYKATEAGQFKTLVKIDSTRFVYQGRHPNSKNLIHTNWLDSLGINTIMQLRSNGSLGIGKAPTYELDVDGTAGAVHFISTQNAMAKTATVEAGAGTGATITGTGSDHAGQITLTTGTGVSAAADLATVTYAVAFPSGFTGVALYPANAAAAALSGNKNVYVTSNGSGFTIKGGSTALSDATAYVWQYVVMR